VGQALKTFGYRHIDGIEFSAAMLNVARPKAIYGKLVLGDLMNKR
jgi:predicted TPR repeat methyltransferase